MRRTQTRTILMYVLFAALGFGVGFIVIWWQNRPTPEAKSIQAQSAPPLGVQ